MTSIHHLIDGFRAFKSTRYRQDKDIITHALHQGIKPTTLFISSCDLRISPDILTSANPGVLYTVTNLGGIVPPMGHVEEKGAMVDIEYAINILQVENLVVLGHAHGDAVKLLMRQTTTTPAIAEWLSIASEVRDSIREQLPDKTPKEQEAIAEEELIIMSLRNLLTYPWISEKADSGTLQLFGWHFDLESGILKSFTPQEKAFDPIG